VVATDTPTLPPILRIRFSKADASLFLSGGTPMNCTAASGMKMSGSHMTISERENEK
jgi:hypothetical protein